MIDVEQDDAVAVVKLNRGVTNAINLELVTELSDALERSRDDPATRAIVLGSANEKFFSIGWDIPGLYDLSETEFRVFFRAYNKLCMGLYTAPKPTVASITGHAIAGGCILALCCDHRVIAEGRKLMSLNEVRLGVPVPYPGDRVLRDLVGARAAREVMEIGAFHEPASVLEMGLVDRVAPPERIWASAMELARSLAELPARAYAIIKRNRTEIVEGQVRSRRGEKEDAFIELWYATETRERLQAAMGRF